MHPRVQLFKCVTSTFSAAELAAVQRLEMRNPAPIPSMTDASIASRSTRLHTVHTWSTLWTCSSLQITDWSSDFWTKAIFSWVQMFVHLDVSYTEHSSGFISWACSTALQSVTDRNGCDYVICMGYKVTSKPISLSKVSNFARWLDHPGLTKIYFLISESKNLLKTFSTQQSFGKDYLNWLKPCDVG